MSLRTLGKLWLDGQHWHLECEPHVALMAKRIFQRIDKGAQGVLKIRHSNDVARDLEWFTGRYPLEVLNRDELTACSKRHVETILTLDRILGENYEPPLYLMALPPRNYQSQAAEIYLKNNYLLLGDDVGIGKTASAITSFCDPRTLPALVVTLAHLPKQWAKEINRFMPDLFVHVLKKGQPYELPKYMGRTPDVIVTNYHKLSGWATVLSKYVKSIVWDEVQELRHSGSNRYVAAQHLALAAEFVIGLSATPIYNYGGEIFNVLNAIKHGLLGDHDEFTREWCVAVGQGKFKIKDPQAFGSWLREQYIMVRRTRADVGRELPPCQRITQEIEADRDELNKIEDAAGELARIILARNPMAQGEKMQAAGQFDALLRQATGLAKAPYVAAFVRLLLENGERVLLYGWHRAVYDIWMKKLEDFNPAMYTGTESPSKKQSESERFIKGETPLMIMSLRAGAGLDGLQFNCFTAVFGELDWSPGVHEQCIGRIFRDGQPEPVIAYFLLSTDGADPIMAETLGIKREQIEGIRDEKPADLERLERNEDGLRKLAEQYLKKKGKHHGGEQQD